MWIAKDFGRKTSQVLFALSDFLFLTLALWLVYGMRTDGSVNLGHLLEILTNINFWIIHFFVAMGLYIFDLYEPRWWRVQIASKTRLSLALLFASGFIFTWLYVTKTPGSALFGRGVLLGAILFFSLPAWATRKLYAERQSKLSGRQRWLLLSSKNARDRLLAEAKARPEIGAWVWLDSREPHELIEKLRLALKEPWTAIIVEGQISGELASLLMEVRFQGRTIMGLKQFYESFWAKVPVESLDNDWFTFEEGFSLFESSINRRLKRVGDIILSVSMILVSMPIWIWLYLLIPLESRGPVIYKQKRVGLDGKVFHVYKFRSMAKDSEKNGAEWAKVNDARVTRIGRFIRKTRIDELPQLWNIINGRMSFVGPRPERPEFTKELADKIPYYNLRHIVKPGLTGWAQVMYPYGASIEDARQKLEYDLFYIKNYSLKLDFEIIRRTVSVVVFGAGR